MSIPSATPVASWRREFGLLLLWLVAWGVTGLLIGHFLAAMLAGVSLYLLLHLAYTYRLHAWLASPDRRSPPEGSGVWQEIYLEFHNITLRSRKRKKHLKNIVDEFRASTAALPDGAVVIDATSCIVWFNEAAGALLNLRAPKDLGQRITNLVRHPQFAEYLADPQAQDHVELASGTLDENLISLKIIPYGNGQRLLIARDINHQKRLETMRRDFVANASHELRTPLTVLRGYLEMMQEEAGHESSLQAWRKPIDEMTQQTQRMGSIVEDLLKLARVEAEGLQQKQEVLQVPTLLERMLAEARKTDDHDRKFTLEADPDLYLFGRPGELESVFSNLLSNAMQYTPPGGEITVRWWRDDTAACFSVTDTGIGIDSQFIPRLTERFYRVDPARSSASGGTGLGLSIVKHCLEHHEAEMDIASELNIGSCFTCRFPLQRAHQRSAA